MLLRESLDTWFARMDANPATYKRYRYELAMFFRFNGPVETGITVDDLDAWRQRAAAGGLSPRTVESVISSVRTLCRNAGNNLTVGRRMRWIRAVKQTPTFAEFCAVIESATWYAGRSAEWWQRWLCWAYCSGLRRGDLLGLTHDERG